ncbi:hypothetical protein C8J57DRAFT_296747 [Mycena rebaudengoi]|nr:hypothetical protein C8J57DRAFT_296747 [Mycena rebaudengoi]
MPLSLFPKLASYVVISINPVATLESLNDPVALAAARQMPVQKYVGYVNKAVDIFDSHAKYHTYSILLTSPTIPQASPDDFIGPDMYTPVFPATTHPLSREPLRPNKPLPWKTCYQPSFMRSVVRVPVTCADDSAAVTLSSLDVTRHRRILAGEEARRSAALRTCTPPALPDRSSYVNFSDLNEYTGDFSCPIDVDRAYEEWYYNDTVESSRPPDTMAVVDISYDLSQVGELPDPLGFFEEKRRLKELEAESITRASKKHAPPPPEFVAPPETQLETEETLEESADTDSEDEQLLLDITELDDPWDVEDHATLPDLLWSMRIPESAVQELASMARRVSIFMAGVKTEGLSLLQSWTMAIRFA